MNADLLSLAIGHALRIDRRLGTPRAHSKRPPLPQAVSRLAAPPDTTMSSASLAGALGTDSFA
jgi:hypothetical protein